MNMDKYDSNEYLLKVTERLKNKGFRITNDVTFNNLIFTHVAKRYNFAIERGGFCNTYFIFTRFVTPDINTLNDFSSKAYKYAFKTGGIHPPRGFLYAMWCFPVAITDSISDKTAELIKKMDYPMHWSAFEKLVVFSLESKM